MCRGKQWATVLELCPRETLRCDSLPVSNKEKNEIEQVRKHEKKET